MTARRPLVIVNGLQQELPAGDNIADPVLAALAQISGYTEANILEIEANTRAGRVTIRPTEGEVKGFEMSSHQTGMTTFHVQTTTFANNAYIFGVGLPHAGIALLKRWQVSCASQAVSGARAGPGTFNLVPLTGVTDFGSVLSVAQPPWGDSSSDAFTAMGTVRGADYHSLKARQPLPQLWLRLGRPNQAAASIDGSATLFQDNSRPYASIGFGVGAAIATHCPPTNLWDADEMGTHPLIIMPHEGAAVTIGTFPAAATSQTVRFCGTLVWDEWQPCAP